MPTPPSDAGAGAAGGIAAGQGATVFVGLGANLGDARATLMSAVDALRALPAAARFAVSAFYRSSPVDATGPDFVNAVARFDTPLAPLALLDALQAIEHRFGRERPFRNAPRTLDLDLLLHGVEGERGGLTSADTRLALPHPRAHRRAFVLAPLAELWPDGEIPGRGRLVDLLTAAQEGNPAQRVERLPG